MDKRVSAPPVLDLGGPRELRLTHRAMTRFSAETGCDLNRLEEVLMSYDNMVRLIKICAECDCLRRGVAPPERRELDDMLDMYSPGHLIGVATRILEDGLGLEESTEEGGGPGGARAPRATAAPATAARATGDVDPTGAAGTA